MSPSSFLLTHFDRLAEAPGGIARLRALVLQLAVTGKLLPQGKADESVGKLLARIRIEKARITKKPVSTVPINRSEIEVPIPSEWAWIKLGDLCSKTGSGSTPRGGKTAYTSSGIPFLRSQNIYDDGLRLDGVAYITPEIHAQMSGTDVVPGDLLLNITGGSIGRCAIVPNNFAEGNVSQHVAILRPAIAGMSGYLHLVVLSPHFQKVMLSSQTGAGREGLPKNRMDEILIPLPPLAEQRRIVAKVEVLMDLCDALEAAQRERESIRTRLRTSALHQLASPDSDSKSAAFVLEQLSVLSSAPEDLTSLRQTFLQLAVQGKLVPAALVSVRAHESPDDESSFSIPTHWTWSRVRELGPTQTGSTPKTQNPENYGKDVPFVRPGDIYPDRIDYNGTCLSFAGLESTGRSVPAGSILMVCIGTLGKSQHTDRHCSFNQQINAVTPRNGIDSRYVFLAMNSPYFQNECLQRSSRTTIAILNKGRWEEIPIPLPPLDEQRRIVTKVDELMAVLDALDATLTTARTTSENLIAASVAKLHVA